MNKIIKKFVLPLLLLQAACSNTTDLELLPSEEVSIFAKNSDRNVSAIIKQENAEYQKRNPEIIKLKYQAMSESPFAFYRATAYLFYKDVLNNSSLKSTINVPLQGDLHLDNIGTYQTSDNKISYDLNDFDDSFVGSYTFDVLRCATSIRLAADENGLDGGDLVETFLKNYYKNIELFIQNPNLVKDSIPKSLLAKHSSNVVNDVSSLKYSSLLSEMKVVNGKFTETTKIKLIDQTLKSNISKAISSYTSSKSKDMNFFKVKDSAYYIAGKGSLGRYRYAILLEGPSTKHDDDLIIEMKEAVQPSVASAGFTVSGSQASRVIDATKYFLSKPDTYFGKTTMGKSEYFVRLVYPNEKVDLTKLNKNQEFEDHLKVVSFIVAKAHAKSGKAKLILQSQEQFDQSIYDYSKEYFKIVKDDYKSFKSGL